MGFGHSRPGLGAQAAISSLYDLGQSLNLSGNLSSSVRRATGRSLTVWLSVLCVNNHDNR